LRKLALKPLTNRKRELLDEYPDLRPDVAYLAGNQGLWPDVKGLPFHIFTERIEDQLNKEAEEASPCRYCDDDKENDVTNPELVPVPNPLDGTSIIPASQYRQPLGLYMLPGHNSTANNAFYMRPHFEASPYGLGWSDGAHDIHISDIRDCPMPDYMRILASGENLPRNSIHAESRSDSHEPAVSSSPMRKLEGREIRR
jgi:hypothetical protein